MNYAPTPKKGYFRIRKDDIKFSDKYIQSLGNFIHWHSGKLLPDLREIKVEDQGISSEDMREKFTYLKSRVLGGVGYEELGSRSRKPRGE